MRNVFFNNQTGLEWRNWYKITRQPEPTELPLFDQKDSEMKTIKITSLPKSPLNLNPATTRNNSFFSCSNMIFCNENTYEVRKNKVICRSMLSLLSIEEFLYSI